MLGPPPLTDAHPVTLPADYPVIPSQPAVLLSVLALKAAYTFQGDTTLQRAAESAFALTTFSGHTGLVTSVAFSPDGKYVLTGSGTPNDPGQDYSARLWTTTSKEIRRFFGHKFEVTAVAFLPDGLTIVTGSRDGSVRL